MTTDWLIAFVGAPAAVVVAASLLVFFTRPEKRPQRIDSAAPSER